MQGWRKNQLRRWRKRKDEHSHILLSWTNFRDLALTPGFSLLYLVLGMRGGQRQKSKIRGSGSGDKQLKEVTFYGQRIRL